MQQSVKFGLFRDGDQSGHIKPSCPRLACVSVTALHSVHHRHELPRQQLPDGREAQCLCRQHRGDTRPQQATPQAVEWDSERSLRVQIAQMDHRLPG
jgi:hypothetical protein